MACNGIGLVATLAMVLAGRRPGRREAQRRAITVDQLVAVGPKGQLQRLTSTDEGPEASRLAASSFWADFYLGCEFNPRLGPLDVKVGSCWPPGLAAGSGSCLPGLIGEVACGASDVALRDRRLPAPAQHPRCRMGAIRTARAHDHRHGCLRVALHLVYRGGARIRWAGVMPLAMCARGGAAI